VRERVFPLSSRGLSEWTGGLPSGFFVMLLVILLPIFAAQAAEGSPRDLVASGNELYKTGRFSEALELYDRALELMPDSLEILFNKGNAYFQSGEFEKARDAYEAVALQTGNKALKAKAHFNLGCAANREALQSDKSEQEALELINLCIRHYKEALKLDSDYRSEAGRGIESARLATFRIQEKIRPDHDSKQRDRSIPADSADDSQDKKDKSDHAGNAAGQQLPVSPDQQPGAKYKPKEPEPRETPADIMREEAEDSGKFRRSSSIGNTAGKDW
jgi:Ca-activated chloride channel homolog